jgi:hypothetical protein
MTLGRKYLLSLTVILALVSCDRSQSQINSINQDFVRFLPNHNGSRLFISPLGDTAYIYRSLQDTTFTEWPLASSNYTRLVEQRRFEFRDSTGRFRASFTLALEPIGDQLMDVEHVTLGLFRDGNSSEGSFKLYMERNPPELSAGAFFPDLVLGTDTLENVFVVGQPTLGTPLLYFTETGGIRGFVSQDGVQYLQP